MAKSKPSAQPVTDALPPPAAPPPAMPPPMPAQWPVALQHLPRHLPGLKYTNPEGHQGIVPKHLFTHDGKWPAGPGIGNPMEPQYGGRPVFHPKFRDAPMIDPRSLMAVRSERLADGSARRFWDDPYVATYPATGADAYGQVKWTVQQVRADHAAEMLSCNWENGGPPMHRLATDAEVAEHIKWHLRPNPHREPVAGGGARPWALQGMDDIPLPPDEGTEGGAP